VKKNNIAMSDAAFIVVAFGATAVFVLVSAIIKANNKRRGEN
jgi:hypothetical protein